MSRGRLAGLHSCVWREKGREGWNAGSQQREQGRPPLPHTHVFTGIVLEIAYTALQANSQSNWALVPLTDMTVILPKCSVSSGFIFIN